MLAMLGQPFAQGMRETLGEHVTVQIGKRNELPPASTAVPYETRSRLTQRQSRRQRRAAGPGVNRQRATYTSDAH